jgi:hypothetical protein
MPTAFLWFRSARPKVAFAFALFTVTTCLLVTGCKVSINKSADGKDKNVQMETPFGGLHVRAGDSTAANLGLPAYPGARIVPDNDGDQAADVALGFGEWQLRVKVVHYETSDPQDKVVAFYRNALAQYGDVLACQGSNPVGKPTVTSEGLTCDEKDGKELHSHVNLNLDEGSYNLRAGSRHHQRIVGFDDKGAAGTQFTLVELLLPAHLEDKNAKSD